jgi:hypothetical protein
LIPRSEVVIAAGLIIVGYTIVLVAASPLANAPVVDSWIYARVVRDFINSGTIRFPGFSQVMPFAQVLYGAVWAKLFGLGDRSLDLSVASLGAAGAIFLYLLMRRSGADHSNSLLALALLVFNPCYLFLSFSFMTEIPFLAALLAALLAAATAIQTNKPALHWLAACLIVVAFFVRPFALAAIPACALALAIDGATRDTSPRTIDSILRSVAPYLLSLLACSLTSLLITRLQATPFVLARHVHDLAHVFRPSLFMVYLRAGLLEPLFYLGLVLAPLAIPVALTLRPRRSLAISGLLFAIGALIISGRDSVGFPQLTCHGGWIRALELRPPTEFVWNPALQWFILAIGSLGAAGLIESTVNLRARFNAPALLLIATSAIYWCAMIPLWLFNDRYQLPLIPAAALILALAPFRLRPSLRIAAFTALAILGLFSLAGVRDYQRGLQMVLDAVFDLEKQGVTRANIDAGYPLNGADLYPFDSDPALDPELNDVAMVTSLGYRDFIIAARPLPGTEIIRRITAPGLFGLASRTIYVLHRID